MNTIMKEAEQILTYVIDVRRHLHRHPELSMQETATSDYVASELEKMNLSPRRLNPTGIIAEIKGEQPGPTIVLRADMDAIPVTERSGVEFSSENIGVMHACGHDAHTAMLLGAAHILINNRKDLAGNVRLIFQPAEESGEGGLLVIKQGGIEGAQAALALHVATQMPAGVLASRAGAILSGVASFKILIKGKGCHGAMPDHGHDATVAAADILMNLQTIVSREISPMSNVVVTVGSLHSGTAYNVVSGEATMEGTVRLFDEGLHKPLSEAIERIATHCAMAHGCTAQLEYQIDSPALVTEQHTTETARLAAMKLVPEERIIWDSPGSMGGEDFAVYTPHLPCSYVVLGVGGEHPIHSEFFLIDESALATGTALYAQFALDSLQKK